MFLQYKPLITLFRLNHPRGAVLLFVPCLWGLIVAKAGWPKPFDVWLFMLGAFVTRSLGCVYNDWVDRDIDGLVERTKERPFVFQKVSWYEIGGVSFCVGLLGIYVLCHLSTKALGASLAFAVLVLPYPWLKRFTYWPQLYLGFLFSSGVLVAFLHVRPLGFVGSMEIFWLYGLGIMWTIYYDTIYAFQDMRDDKKCGLKSTALLCERSPKVFLSLCAIMMLLCGLAFGMQKNLSLFYFIALMFAVCLWVFQIQRLNTSDPQLCLRLFVENQLIGLVVAVALLAGFVF